MMRLLKRFTLWMFPCECPGKGKARLYSLEDPIPRVGSPYGEPAFSCPECGADWVLNYVGLSGAGGVWEWKRKDTE